MQVLPLLIVIVVLAADGRALGFAPEPQPAAAIATAYGLPCTLAVIVWLMVRAGLRRADRTGQVEGLMRAERLLSLSRWIVLAAHAVSIYVFGWLEVIRSWIGTPILLDELAACTGPVVGLVALWSAQYGLERRVRQALFLRRLDAMQPIHPLPGRLRWVVGQVRVHLLMLGVPVLAVVTQSEAWSVWAAGRTPPPPSWMVDVASFAGAMGVFIIAPLIMRMVLPITRMPVVSIRRELTELAAAVRVRVGDVLLWKTDGTLVNAAVVGLLAPLRYVLLTDGLVEQMARPSVRAVIAHELAHVRHRHVPWLVLSLGALVLVGSALATIPILVLIASGDEVTATTVERWSLAGAVATLLVGAWVFGWVSRRFERQADTFAVQTLSRFGCGAEEARAEAAAADVAAAEAEAGEVADAAEAGEVAAAADADRAAGASDSSDGSDLSHETGGGIVAAGETSDARASSDRPRVAAAPASGPTQTTRAAPTPSDRVTADAVRAMQTALGLTARLNGVHPAKRSWRHGSIAWRQAYLATLVGLPVEALPIDRTVRRLKIVAILGLLVGGGALWGIDALDRHLQSRDRATAYGSVASPATASMPTAIPAAGPRDPRDRRDPGVPRSSALPALPLRVHIP